MICGFDGLYRSVNPAWSEMLGWPADSLVGARFDAFVHPDDRKAAEQAMDRLRSGAILDNLDIRQLAADGSERWVSWNAIPAG